MLDLKKLEEKLDKALANETSESLTNWLQEKRLRSYLQSLGEGIIVNASSYCSETIFQSKDVRFDLHFSEIYFWQDYPNAA